MKKITYLLIFSLSLFSCTQTENNDASKNDNKNNVQAYNEQRMREFYAQVMNAHNPAMIDSFCTTDFVDHSPFPGQQPNLDGLKKGMSDFMAGIPDMNCTVDWVKCFGDTCVAKFRMRGTNTGMFMGAPATGKPMDIEGVDIIIIKDGKAKEHWGYVEEVKMMTQLGMGSQAPETGVKEQND